MEFNKQLLSTEWGEIDYCYIEKDEKYPDGLLIFMGSFVYSKYRRQGKYKEMVATIFSKYPKGTTVQIPITKHWIKNMFVQLGFVRVKQIEYWGSPSNCTLLQGKI